MDVPISTSAEESKNGIFRYSTRILEDPSLRGVFAFSFYLRNERENLDKNVYIKGIMLYVSAIAHEDSIFQGWKIVIYTDPFSYGVIRDKLTHPSIELVQILWPYYTPGDTGAVNGDILRVMRFRALFDFPRVAVFVRDADTIWENTSYKGEKFLTAEPEEAYQWEKNFYEAALAYPNKWFFGTSLGYHRFWHTNKHSHRESPLGAFAGFQSVIPTVPCFQTMDLWNRAIEYCFERSARSMGKRRVLKPGTRNVFEDIDNVLYSNEDEKARIGKDEQIITFVFLPECFDHIFFFEFDWFFTRPLKTKKKIATQPNYPGFIIGQGSNANLKALFEKGIRTGFLTNLAEDREAIKQRNTALQEAKLQELFTMLNTLHDANAYLLHNKDNRRAWDIRTGVSQAVKSIYDTAATKVRDPKVHRLYLDFQQANDVYSDSRGTFYTRFTEGANGFDQETEFAALKKLSEGRNAKLRVLMDKIFSEISRKDIESHYDVYNQKSKQKLLNFYEGKEASRPPAAAGAGPLAGYNYLKPGEKIISVPPLGRKGGRRTRKQKERKLKTRKYK